VSEVKLLRYPYRARAWWGEVRLAQSDTCLCVEREGAPPVLWFPRDDIDFALLREDPGGPVTGGPGRVQRWSVREADQAGGAVLDVLSEPAATFPELGDHGTFDPERVRVEVIDGPPGVAPAPAMLKRFPVWGDAQDLVDVMNVQPDGELRFVGVARTDGRRPIVEGSQMLGQAVVAAGRYAPARRVVSAGMLFLRAADAGRPLDFELAVLSEGRTFSGLAVQVLQGGRCCAAGTLLLDATAPDLIRHASAPPDVPGPDACAPLDMAVTGRDIRVVDGAYNGDLDAPVGPPVLDCWVRFRDVPEDPALHAGLLAQFAGHMPIAAALRPHAGIGQSAAHRTVSMGINAISLSLHGPVRADEWMLYHHLSTFAGDGMTHAECRVHAGSGALLASFSVDAMVRDFPAGSGEQDERRAM
jgi:acyl-CoA thioesterase II